MSPKANRSTDKPAARRTRKWTRRREEIIEAAEKVFAERGYEAAKLEHVAERVEMQRPSLHYYFKGKEDLYDVVIGEIVKGHLATVKEIAARNLPPAEFLQAIANNWIEFGATRPEAARLQLEQYYNDRLPVTPSATAARRKIFAIIGDALKQHHLQSGAPLLDTVQFILLFSGLSLFWGSVRERMISRLQYDTLGGDNLEQFRRIMTGFSADLVAGRYQPGKP
ncbi:MAG TPA: TetR/AcrR family transcriptional regulator [Spongiibacteraceae bacterium]|jgi:AcrR family transcriptional regulator|nr:TetR/AcrR family transcriptional regulator [Spongiibacteraceae bacterium]HUH38731.1 TetR/AcrR family transcriptional regulator [Spongiibacteraceae bacterium]